MDMTLAQVRGFMAAINRIERDAMVRAAVAARVAQAEEKGWKKVMREWERGE